MTAAAQVRLLRPNKEVPMAATLADKLVVAISSRALFDLDASHRVFEEQGVEAYIRYQIDHEDDILEPGVAFPLVKKMLALNARDPARPVVEVILLSRNSADTGLRVFNAIRHYDLGITRAVFTRGESPFRYLPAFGAHLYLSANPDDVGKTLKAGFAAATILPSKAGQNLADAAQNEAGPWQGQLRIAFDGDAVLFSDEAERVFKSEGLDAFHQSERDAAREPLSGGPFKNFLSALHRIQAAYPPEDSPIRTALVTARGAPAHERVVRTLRAWNIRIDEALFLGGLSKGEFLKAFDADIFFDDQIGHCESASEHVATGHVPHGIANERAA
jgi:5'-nucleotidase